MLDKPCLAPARAKTKKWASGRKSYSAARETMSATGLKNKPGNRRPGAVLRHVAKVLPGPEQSNVGKLYTHV